MSNYNPKIAIVCDWITGTGGAERVIKELHDLFPDAPIYTSTHEVENGTLFKYADIRTAWFQKLPKFLRRHQLLTLPRQWHFGHLKLKGYDVVFSAGSSEAKAVRAPDGVHINMCYTPTLYYWIKPEEYLNRDGSGGLNPIWRLGLKILMPYVKRWDLNASKRPDKIYAISTAVQDRIKKYYGRDSDLLHPPTDISRFTNDGAQKRSGFVTFGRQVQHKRFDLSIAACNEAQVPLLVIGQGPEHDRLMRMAGSTISFKSNVSDEDIVKYISKAEAFIFPNEEDFGIVAVEAQAAGTPVIAYRAGGALDTVIEGITGEFFNEQTSSKLAEVLKTFNYKLYNRKSIVDNAQKFSNHEFHKNVQKIIRTIIVQK
jgi:glycosyltransferase involved in cell wall biosynthesis